MNFDETLKMLEDAIRLTKIQMGKQSSGKEISDDEIVACRSLLNEWTPGEEAKKDACMNYHGLTYRCVQPHTMQTGWEPDKTPAMWAGIEKAHAGTREDPIPARRGMEYVYGKYYLDETLYICSRQGESEGGKIILQFLPHELEGQYFERA